MAWAYIAHRGTGFEKVNDKSLVFSPSTTLAVGTIQILRYTTDNASLGGDTESDLHSLADDKGNIWTKLREHNRGTSARAATTASIFASKITTAILATDNITLTIGGSVRVDAKVGGIEEFTVAAGKTFSLVGDNGVVGATNYTVTLSGLVSAEHLWLGVFGPEGPNSDSFTQDTNFANNTNIGTTGGGAASNVSNRFGSRILTATSETWNGAATGRDHVVLLVALDEIDEPAAEGPEILAARSRLAFTQP